MSWSERSRSGSRTDRGRIRQDETRSLFEQSMILLSPALQLLLRNRAPKPTHPPSGAIPGCLKAAPGTVQRGGRTEAVLPPDDLVDPSQDLSLIHISEPTRLLSISY